MWFEIFSVTKQRHDTVNSLTNVTQRTHVLVEVDVEKFVRIVRRFVFHLIVGQSSSLTNTDKLRPSLLHDKLTYSLVS